MSRSLSDSGTHGPIGGRDGGDDVRFEELRTHFVAGFPARIDALRGLAQPVRAGDPQAIHHLQGLAHKLAGAGGTFGWPEISEQARALEHCAPQEREARLDALLSLLERIQTDWRASH